MSAMVPRGPHRGKSPRGFLSGATSVLSTEQRVIEQRVMVGYRPCRSAPRGRLIHGWEVTGLHELHLLSLVEAVLIIVLFVQWRRRRTAEHSLAERLRFEELLSQLYARFVHVWGADVDVEIRLGLSRIGEFLGVDRATLVEVDEQARCLLQGHRWARPGAERAPYVTLDRVPWVVEHLRRGEIVRFSRPDELPPEASVDRKTYESIGTRSHVAVPLMAGTSVLGGMLFSTLETERAWPDELVQRLGLLGEVFATAIARRRADEALRESRALSGAIVDSLPGRVVVIDRAGIIIAVNEAAEHATAGRNANSGGLAIGADYLAVWRQAYAAGDQGAGDILKGIEAVLAETSLHFSLEYLVAQERWYEFRVDSLRTQAGGAVVSRLDIGDRKRAEVEAREMRNELARVGRAAHMGQLTAALAHEVNQPLTGILSNAQAARRMLAKDNPDLKEIRAILDDIVADDRRAGEIVTRLRAMLGRRQPETTVIDVNQLVRDVVRFLHSDAVLRNATLVQELEAAVPVIAADLVPLQQVLINLVLNGLDAMKHLPPERRRLIVKTEWRDEMVCVAVRDFGTGLPAAGRERLFEPFYTTKADGMGMGLPIARSIVQAHGGQLWAMDNDDQGATFFFTLPAAAADRDRDAPGAEASSSELMT